MTQGETDGALLVRWTRGEEARFGEAGRMRRQKSLRERLVSSMLMFERHGSRVRTGEST